jgi:hypothetical protein
LKLKRYLLEFKNFVCSSQWISTAAPRTSDLSASEATPYFSRSSAESQSLFAAPPITKSLGFHCAGLKYHLQASQSLGQLAEVTEYIGSFFLKE